jgi:hypothetical protein
MRSGHDEIKEMFPEYLRGSLSEEMRDKVKVHLKSCEECRGELSLISELAKIEISDPGDLFYETLLQKVKVALKEKKASYFPLRSLLFRQLPVAVTIAVLVLVVLTYTKKKEIPELDPFFKDPFMAEVLDYSYITEEDIPTITEQLPDDELYLYSVNFTGYSYHREFASLSSKELGSLYEALKEKRNTGG